MKTVAQVLILITCFSIAGSADDMWPGGSYLPDVPEPKTVLGYELGEKHTPHYMLERYLEAVAEASNRVMIRPYGKTWLGRTQYHVVISTPENIAGLDDIRTRISELTNADIDQSRLDEITAGTPAIAMLNYSVHGNEASGVEAALRTIYQLAAGTDEKTLQILENVVTVIDPVQNPDGHDRYVHFINDYIAGEPNANPDSLEHSEPWPGGRTNAYFFDLNRDWFLMTQQESRNRTPTLLYWLPQVAPDLHEMGSNATYYFAPPMEPLNPIFPPVMHKWWEIYGQANAAALDSIGETYYTRESFDIFYLGYGESLPGLYGAVGMTYEQASARARVVRRRDDTLLTLKDGVRNHFLTSMATLDASASRRIELLQDFNTYFKQTAEQIRKQAEQVYYLPPSDPARVDKLLEKLETMGVEVQVAAAEFTIAAVDFATGREGQVTLPAGTAIVSTDQFAGNVVRAVLQPDHELNPEFLEEEKERMHRNLPSRFYDVTAWNMPMTYGIPAYYSAAEPDVETREWEPSDVTTLGVPTARVAYVIDPNTNANIALVARLLNAGYKTRVARMSFTLDDTEFPPGTVVLRVSRNPESLHEDMVSFIAETGGRVHAADTGYTPDGIDLGSNNILHIKDTKVALLADSPVSGYSFGAIRYLFEQAYGLDYTAVRVQDFGSFELDDYTVLVIPDTWGSRLGDILGSGGVSKLKEWVRDGGVLIAFSDTVKFLASEDVGLTSAPYYTQRRKKPGEVEDAYAQTPVEEAVEEEETDEKDEKKKDEEKYEVEELIRVPGAILRVRLDDRSFLSWGYEGGMAYVLVNSSNVFVPISDDQGYAAARFYAEQDVLAAGHIWPESKKLLAGNAYAWHERAGRGIVICFAEDPTFRASYDGLDRMLFNAIFFGSAFTR